MAGEEPRGTPRRHLLEHEEPLKGNAQMILSLSSFLSLAHMLPSPQSIFFCFIINDYTPFFFLKAFYHLLQNV